MLTARRVKIRGGWGLTLAWPDGAPVILLDYPANGRPGTGMRPADAATLAEAIAEALTEADRQAASAARGRWRIIRCARCGSWRPRARTAGPSTPVAL